MKYKELFEALKGMREDHLDAEVMVFENGGDNMDCHVVADDISLHIAPMGAIVNGETITDDFYGIGDVDEAEMVNVKKLLDCHQPYLMMGNGCIPTCKEGC